MFMQFQRIVFIQRQGNNILVNYREMNSFKGHIFIHKKYNHSRQLYSFTESYSFQGTYQFILGNISSFKENIFREIISTQGYKFVQVQGHMFVQGNYIHLTLLRSRT